MQATIHRDPVGTGQGTICLGRSFAFAVGAMLATGAALQAARLGKLAEGSGAYEQNQLARCERLPVSDRDDCVRRLSEGSVSGSVEGRGIYRELRTPEPEPAPAPLK